MAGLIKAADLAKVRTIDFIRQFNGSLKKLTEALGTTRKIPVTEGTTLKVLKVTGTLESGTVAEGETIPLSKYQTTYTDIGEINLKKWAKGTTAEAILKGGYDQAVGETTDKMLKDIQKGIRTDFFTGLATGTGAASGSTLQSTLAQVWGQLQILWEDDAVDTAYFINPLDVADYLASATVSIQNAFGMQYIKNFLGLGTVFLISSVPQKKIYATAKENVIMYYINVGNSELGTAFKLETDETGYVGIKEYPEEGTATIKDLVMSGVTFFPERIDGIVIGTINP